MENLYKDGIKKMFVKPEETGEEKKEPTKLPARNLPFMNKRGDAKATLFRQSNAVLDSDDSEGYDSEEEEEKEITEAIDVSKSQVK